MLDAWKAAAQGLKREVYALYLAYRDPRTPWVARVWAGLVVAYAFSPIDLIPDFIPILGYADDLVLIPLGVAVALRLIPPQVMADSRLRAGELIHQGKPVSRWGIVVVAIIWAGLAALGIWLGWRFLNP